MIDASDPGKASVDISLDLRQAHQHLVGVRLQFQPQQRRLKLALPAWTPGSYLVRDYVRQLEGLAFEQDGVQLQSRRQGVASWCLELPRLSPVLVRYRLLATELSVRTCHLDGDHGFLSLAAVVLLVEEHRWSPHQLSLQLPAAWDAFVPLQPHDGGWRAADFDRLVDAPLEVGPHPCHHFSVAGVPHRWVSWGGDLPTIDGQWLADVEALCLACCRLLGEPRPASAAYLFILHLRDQGFGGLEHDDASVLVFGRRALERAEGRRRLLQLVAHEYLHQWNVRRLRPAELSPVDYERPTIVPTLWFAEGVTSYFDQLLTTAADLVSEAELLDDLGADLSRYLLTPGRQVQSLRLSSQEAWVKLYRQDAWSADSQISYYLKGAVLSLVLDLHLRRHGSCLAVVLQDLWRIFGRCRRGYRETDLVAALGKRAADLPGLMAGWLDGHEDPDLQGYLGDLGLLLQPQMASAADAGWRLDEAVSGSLRLSHVSRHGAAAVAGLQVGDELLAVDGLRLRREEDLLAPLGLTASGKPRHSSLTLLFCRDGRVREVNLRPNPAAIQRWTLSQDPQAPASAQERRRRWLRLQPEP